MMVLVIFIKYFTEMQLRTSSLTKFLNQSICYYIFII